ncbi:MAG: EAL domain-containing protein [Bacillaceae bacterium]|nr:EAL domain-containing protein [Bacillaceae bacterium]
MSIETLLRKDDFFHYYQPIYNIQEWTLVGYEVLFRSDRFNSPEQTFELAKKEKKLFELDTKSICKAAKTYSLSSFSKCEGTLFLNIFPSTLLHTQFPSFIKNVVNQVESTCRLVLEINESGKVSNFDRFSKIISMLKSIGISIAIDDLGKGNLEIKSILEYEPDFIKIDRYLIDGIAENLKKQSMLKLLKKYCGEFGIELIAEGIEQPKELAIVKSLGIEYGQGYALGKPSPLLNKIMR